MTLPLGTPEERAEEMIAYLKKFPRSMTAYEYIAAALKDYAEERVREAKADYGETLAKYSADFESKVNHQVNLGFLWRAKDVEKAISNAWAKANIQVWEEYREKLRKESAEAHALGFREGVEALRERIKTAERCPNCPDQGWYVVPNRNTGEAEQEQCQWCYETKNSLFNALLPPSAEKE